jgi:hypothetical protein
MVCPQVADEGDGIQIWRVAVNIPSACGQLTRSGPPVRGLAMGLATAHHKNKLLMKYKKKKPRTWTVFGEMGKACSTNGGKDECIQDIGGKARRDH